MFSVVFYLLAPCFTVAQGILAPGTLANCYYWGSLVSVFVAVFFWPLFRTSVLLLVIMVKSKEISQGLKPGTHHPDIKELAATKVDCYVTCVRAKKSLLNRPQKTTARVAITTPCP